MQRVHANIPFYRLAVEAGFYGDTKTCTSRSVIGWLSVMLDSVISPANATQCSFKQNRYIQTHTLVHHENGSKATRKD